jgi:hypothetical protein
MEAKAPVYRRQVRLLIRFKDWIPAGVYPVLRYGAGMTKGSQRRGGRQALIL